jgi:hypothetical protein
MGRRVKASVQRIRSATLAQIEERLAPALDPMLLQKSETAAYSRERIFPLARTFWCWLWQVLQANTSCREVVRQVQVLFALHGDRSVDEGTAAYCQARAKLPLVLLQKIFRASSRKAEQNAPVLKILQGRPVRIIDGSGCRLPDTPQNRKVFPAPRSQSKASGFPYLRFAALFSLASGALLAHAIGSLRRCELRLFLVLRHSLRQGDILLADRAYGKYLAAALLQLQGVDILARLSSASRRVDFRKAIKRLDFEDALFVWKKPVNASPLLSRDEWRGLPAEITIRIIRTPIRKKGFRIRELVVMTTLLDVPLYPAEDILRAYLLRWKMEMCLDDLKTTLDMEHLSCRSPKMAHKELLLFFIAHNLIRWIMTQAAQNGAADLTRISYKGTLDGLRQWTQALVQLRGRKYARKKDALWKKFLHVLIADAVPERLERREPRVVKRRQKYDYLNCPRRKYKERPKRNIRRDQAKRRKRADTLK